jgi:DNA-directed RNA polymerase subunit RPC12/RpoP
MSCPFCTKQKVSWFYNLALLFPKIIKNWDYEKNKIPPEQYLPYASDKVYWICEKCNLSWKASIVQRTSGNTGCSFCNSKKTTPTNNLAFLYPDLMNQWDYLKNSILPSEYLPQSNKKAYWLCPICNHSWQAKIQDRVAGKRCPVESGKVVSDFNCLSKTNPKLAKEWHQKNIKTSKDVTYGLKLKVWWMCSNCENEYQAIILNRSKGNGCNECKFRIAPEFINNNSYFHK